MAKKILIIVLILLLLIIQTSFISGFWGVFNNFNLIFYILIFYSVIIGFEQSLVLSFIFGILLEPFTLLNFGVTTLCLLLSLFLVNLLFHALFTNKSLYSLLVLLVIGICINNLFVFIFNNFLFLIGLSGFKITLNVEYFSAIIWQSFLGMIFLSVAFTVFKAASRKLNSVFLITE